MSSCLNMNVTHPTQPKRECYLFEIIYLIDKNYLPSTTMAFKDKKPEGQGQMNWISNVFMVFEYKYL